MPAEKNHNSNPTVFGPASTQLMFQQYPAMSRALMPAVILGTEGGIFFSNVTPQFTEEACGCTAGGRSTSLLCSQLFNSG